MVDKQALLGGICLAIGGLPLILFYGIHPFGYIGVAIVFLGVMISYGAYIS